MQCEMQQHVYIVYRLLRVPEPRLLFAAVGAIDPAAQCLETKAHTQQTSDADVQHES